MTALLDPVSITMDRDGAVRAAFAWLSSDERFVQTIGLARTVNPNPSEYFMQALEMVHPHDGDHWNRMDDHDARDTIRVAVYALDVLSNMVLWDAVSIDHGLTDVGHVCVVDPKRVVILLTQLIFGKRCCLPLAQAIVALGQPTSLSRLRRRTDALRSMFLIG